jgi:hypothetical protein
MPFESDERHPFTPEIIALHNVLHGGAPLIPSVPPLLLQRFRHVAFVSRRVSHNVRHNQWRLQLLQPLHGRAQQRLALPSPDRSHCNVGSHHGQEQKGSVTNKGAHSHQRACSQCSGSTARARRDRAPQRPPRQSLGHPLCLDSHPSLLLPAHRAACTQLHFPHNCV